MNERIKELAQEAGMYVDVKGEPWPKWMGAEECEVAYKKFAELIVRECASKVDYNLRDWLQDSNQTIGDKILEHFGVEE
jgi:hypothetical protein